MVSGSEVYITVFVSLALLSAAPLFTETFRATYYDEGKHEEIVHYSIIICMGSLFSSIPMLLDLILDLDLPWVDLYPRATLIASQVIPNGMILLCYKMGYPKSYLQTAFVCAVFMRVNFLRGSLVSHIFRHDYPVGLTKSAAIWSAIGIVKGIFDEYTLFMAPQWSVGVRQLFDVVTAIFFASLVLFIYHAVSTFRDLYYSDSSDAEVMLYGVSFTLLWLSNAVVKNYSFNFDLWGLLLLGLVMDYCVATTGFYVSGKKSRSAHNRTTVTLASKRAFMRYIAHEIRTPLNTSAVGLQLVLKSRESEIVDPETETLIDSLTSIDVAIDILNDLLLVDKVDNGQMILEKEEVDGLLAVKSVFQSFVAQATSKKISYSLEAEDGVSGASILVDRKKYGQVLRNFISNAMKFTPQGGSVRVILSVRAGSDGSGPMMRAQVSDSGVGIKPQNLKRLFHEVVQFDAAKLQDGGGSGLGLTITKAIMDAHGGSVGATSMYGHGSNFYADIAIAESKPGPADANSFVTRPYDLRGYDRSISRTISPFPQASKLDNRLDHILLVDDSTLSLKMMKKLMKSCAHEVSIASDGNEALNMVRAAQSRGEPAIDMVITDYRMPHMDGMELTACLRAFDYTGYIVLLTGEEPAAVSASFLSVGGNLVCQKPLQIQSIAKVLADYWDNIKQANDIS